MDWEITLEPASNSNFWTALCPIHHCRMQAETVPTRNGQFTRMWCPTQEDGTRCYVTYTTEQGEEAFKQYLGTVEKQLHPFYKHSTLIGYQCHCHKSLILKMSRSEANPGRLFFSCPWSMCRLFQWGDQSPTEKNRAWLLHESRDSQGYPKRGIDVVPVREQPIREQPTSSIPPFHHQDDALWKDCQKMPIFLADNSNKILSPRELLGLQYDKARDQDYRRKVYLSRYLAKSTKGYTASYSLSVKKSKRSQNHPISLFCKKVKYE